MHDLKDIGKKKPKQYSKNDKSPCPVKGLTKSGQKVCEEGKKKKAELEKLEKDNKKSEK